MKKSLSGTILGLFFLTSFVSAELILSHFKGSVYICEDDYYSKENSLVYVGEDEVTIIGATWTPATAELLHVEIGKVTSKPVSSVINTNYHPDRAGGNAYWKSIGAEIYATEQTCKLLETDWEEVMQWTRQYFTDFPLFPATMPTRRCGERFELEKGKIKGLYLGPSHTTDGIFVYLPEEKILYGGCILKYSLGNLTYADVNAYPQTLQNLKKEDLEIDHVIAGHGKPVHGPGLVDHYLSLLKQHLEG